MKNDVVVDDDDDDDDDDPRRGLPRGCPRRPWLCLNE